MHFCIVASLKIIHFEEIRLIIDQMKRRFIILNLHVYVYIYKISTIE